MDPSAVLQSYGNWPFLNLLGQKFDEAGTVNRLLLSSDVTSDKFFFFLSNVIILCRLSRFVAGFLSVRVL